MRIKKLKINEKEIPLANMVLIVGANGTGKTRLLDEIHASFAGRSRGSNFWNLTFEHEIEEEDKKIWHENLHEFTEGDKTQWYCPFTKNNNEGRKLSQQEHEDLSDSIKFTNYFANSDFLKKELTHYLPVKERLDVPSSAQMTSPRQVASDRLNILFRSPKMLNSIQNHLRHLFKKELYLAPHNLPQLDLKLANSYDEKLPAWLPNEIQKSFQKYLKWEKDNKIGDINIEGHGILAFLHIMLSYTLPTNAILMIDEPEIHLYPSIKRKFGQLLGSLAQKSKKQFICVTHDSDFLQGVFDAKCNLDILKLSKINKEHSIINTSYKTSSSLWAKHNQTSFLQLAFLDCGIIVEGSTDRLVYEYVFSDQKFLENVEYKFIAAGGADSIANPEKIAQDLKVPYVVIMDFDTLRGEKRKNKPDETKVEKLLKLSQQTSLLEKVKVLGPKLKGINNLREKGLDAVADEDLKKEAKELIEGLEKIGIFIVPYGCLESWGKITCMPGEFPEKFIRAYRSKKREFTKLTTFLAKIGTYLRNEMS